MVRIGRLTDYGVALLTSFLREPVEALNARELSEDCGLPLPTVSKLLKMLSKGGLLVSERGVHGGYRLKIPADQITLARIVEVLEGPIALTHCSSHESAFQCDRRGYCVVSGKWQKVSHIVKGTLEGVTLKDLASELGEPQLQGGSGSAVSIKVAGRAENRSGSADDLAATTDRGGLGWQEGLTF